MPSVAEESYCFKKRTAGVRKSGRDNVEKTLTKNHLFGNFIVCEYSVIFGLFENVYIDFWALALNIKMHPCLTM